MTRRARESERRNTHRRVHSSPLTLVGSRLKRSQEYEIKSKGLWVESQVGSAAEAPAVWTRGWGGSVSGWLMVSDVSNLQRSSPIFYRSSLEGGERKKNGRPPCLSSSRSSTFFLWHSPAFFLKRSINLLQKWMCEDVVGIQRLIAPSFVCSIPRIQTTNFSVFWRLCLTIILFTFSFASLKWRPLPAHCRSSLSNDASSGRVPAGWGWMSSLMRADSFKLRLHLSVTRAQHL